MQNATLKNFTFEPASHHGGTATTAAPPPETNTSVELVCSSAGAAWWMPNCQSGRQTGDCKYRCDRNLPEQSVFVTEREVFLPDDFGFVWAHFNGKKKQPQSGRHLKVFHDWWSLGERKKVCYPNDWCHWVSSRSGPNSIPEDQGDTNLFFSCLFPLQKMYDDSAL